MKILILLLSLFIGSQLSSQIDFADELYARVALENIELLDSLGEDLNLDKSLAELFFRIDTVMNCWGEPKEKFINFEKWPLGVAQSIISFDIDTLSNKFQKDLINFYRIIYNDYYEIEDKIYLFTTHRQTIYTTKELADQIHIDKQILTKKNCYWAVESIKLDNQSFQLDSCHLKYKLEIDSDGKFGQNYGNGQIKCDCLLTNAIIKERSNDLSLNDHVFHNLTISSGKIRTYKRKLVISNEGGDNAIEYDYDYLDEKLILRNSNNYIITFKRNQACSNR